jgi:hypothetical protein
MIGSSAAAAAAAAAAADGADRPDGKSSAVDAHLSYKQVASGCHARQLLPD